MQLCEDSLTFNNFRSWYFIQTASKTKENKSRSKQNTYHVVNKNIAPSKVTDRSRRKRGCLPAHPQALAFRCP